MKLKFKLLFALLLLFPFGIKALSGTASLSCATTKLATNGTTSCSLYYTVSSGTLSGVSANVSGSNISVTSVAAGTGWMGNPTTSFIAVYGQNITSGKVLVATINVKFTGTSSGTLTVSGITISDNEGNESATTVSPVTFSVVNTDTSLKTLTVDGQNVLGSMSYTTDKSSVNINAAGNGTSALANGAGTKSLGCGLNKFEIKVTAESGDSKVYTLNITRTCSSDATLKSITLDNGTISFSPNTLEYKVELLADVGSLTATAEKNDSLATIDQVSKKVNVNKGKSAVITFNVTAQDGTKKAYKINVTRVDDRSTDNTLKSLEVLDSNGNNLITFGSKTNYNITVDYEVSEVNVKAIANDSKSSIKGKVGKQKLNVGSNKLTVTVTAENETTKNYIITINRKDEIGNIEQIEDNTILGSLSVDGYEIDFNANTFEYSIDIEKDVTGLNISAVPLDQVNYKISIEGNGDFVEGKNAININVLDSSDQIVNTYTIYAVIAPEEEPVPVVEEKKTEEPKKNNNIILFAGIGVLALVVVILIVVLVSKKKKNANVDLVQNEEKVKDIPGTISNAEGSVIVSDSLSDTQVNEIVGIKIDEEPSIEQPQVVQSVKTEVSTEPVAQQEVPVVPVVPQVDQPVVNQTVEVPKEVVLPQVELPKMNQELTQTQIVDTVSNVNVSNIEDINKEG